MLRTEIFGKPPPLMVRFFVGSEKDVTESEKLGAPVYKDKIRAFVQVSGERDYTTIDVNEDHISQYPREWELFQRSNARERPIPLESLPKMRPCIKDALAELNIRSVQELAAAQVPEYLAPFKNWAVQVLGIHNVANGKEKPRFKLVAA
jgi:hypothetical protein